MWLHVSICPWVQVPTEAKHIGFTRARIGIQVISKLLLRFWEMGILEEQQVLLTAESYL